MIGSQGMQGKTRAQKPKLELEIDTFTRMKKLVKINEVVKDVEVELDNCINVEPIVSPSLETLDVEARLEEEATPSKLSEDTPLGIETLREEVPVEIDRKVGEDTNYHGSGGRGNRSTTHTTRTT